MTFDYVILNTFLRQMTKKSSMGIFSRFDQVLGSTSQPSARTRRKTFYCRYGLLRVHRRLGLLDRHGDARHRCAGLHPMVPARGPTGWDHK